MLSVCLQNIFGETIEAMQHPRKYYKSYTLGFIPLFWMIVPAGILLNLAFAKSGIATAGELRAQQPRRLKSCQFVRPGITLSGKILGPALLPGGDAHETVLPTASHVDLYPSSLSTCPCIHCCCAGNWFQLCPPGVAKYMAVWLMIIHNIQAWVLW